MTLPKSFKVYDRDAQTIYSVDKLSEEQVSEYLESDPELDFSNNYDLIGSDGRRGEIRDNIESDEIEEMLESGEWSILPDSFVDISSMSRGLVSLLNAVFYDGVSASEQKDLKGVRKLIDQLLANQKKTKTGESK